MPFSLPVRRFLQGTEKVEAPNNRFGALQWVLSRSLYRFKIFDFSQVPAKSRGQALSLELAQWTPFAKSAYYTGWLGAQALVWGWDANKVNTAIEAQKLKSHRVLVLPETVLQSPIGDGLCLSRCTEGFDGQHWRGGRLERSRWWPAIPAPDEWLMFQRDAGIAPAEQQVEPPQPQSIGLHQKPWIFQSGSSDGKALQSERLVVALVALALLLPTFWYGFSWYKVEVDIAALREQQAQMRKSVEPITSARGQALDYLARTRTLSALAPYPEQLALMAAVARVLPQDKSYIKEWDFKEGVLKITLSSSGDISTTSIIGLLQQAGPFKDVKALPGRNLKSVTFQMEVSGSGNV